MVIQILNPLIYIKVIKIQSTDQILLFYMLKKFQTCSVQIVPLDLFHAHRTIRITDK